MANQTIFKDPAFHCEVVLKGQTHALYERNKVHYDRLKAIRNLGLIGHFDDTAIHSKFHHAVGLMHSFEKLLVHQEGVGLPKSFLWSFWPRLCFAQAGHTNFAYDGEKALVLAAQIDSDFKSSLISLFTPLIAYCDRIKHKAKRKNKIDISKETLEGRLERLVIDNEWKQLHLWIAAAKIVDSKASLSILKQQEKKEKGEVGFVEEIAFDMLLNPKSEWDSVCRRVSRLDYVVRDLAFTGRMGVNLDTNRLLTHVTTDDDPDWKLITTFDRYLTDTLYASVDHQVNSQVVQRALIKLFIDGEEIDLKKFCGLEGCYPDRDVVDILLKNKVGQLALDSAVNESWCFKSIRSDILKENNFLSDTLCLLEGFQDKSKMLASPKEKKVFSFLDVVRNDVVVAMYHSKNERVQLADFLLQCSNISDQSYPFFSAKDYFKAVTSSICGHTVKSNIHSVIEHLSDICPSCYETFKDAFNYIYNESEIESYSEQRSLLIRNGKRYVSFPVSADFYYAGKKFQSPEAEENFSVRYKFYTKAFWTHVIIHQQRYFLNEPDECVKAFLNEVQQVLIDRITSSSKTKDKDTEVFAFLRSLLVNSNEMCFCLSLPNFEIMKEDGVTPENEYDVVSIFVDKNKTINFWVWGCTTEQKIIQKRSEDTEKIDKLFDKLRERWEGQRIRFVQNYVSKRQAGVSVIIDGVHKKYVSSENKSEETLKDVVAEEKKASASREGSYKVSRISKEENSEAIDGNVLSQESLEPIHKGERGLLATLVDFFN